MPEDVAVESPFGNAKPLANPSHTAVVVVILGIIAAAGYRSLLLAQSAPPGRATGSTFGTGLLLSAGGEWLLVLYVWAGVRRKGGHMNDLIGHRWRSWRDVLADAAIAIPFWALWTAVARISWQILGPSSGRSANLNFPPRGARDIAIWIAASLTAGFCEEVIFRGYLQKQFFALTSSVAFAVAAQALLFGVGHIYQGYKAVGVVSILGVLYGALAQWRASLLPGMLSHAWSDIFEGYVKHVL